MCSLVDMTFVTPLLAFTESFETHAQRIMRHHLNLQDGLAYVGAYIYMQNIGFYMQKVKMFT